jgi:hypothetical protein
LWNSPDRAYDCLSLDSDHHKSNVLQYLREIAEFLRQVITQVSAYITGGIVAAGVFVYERYSGENIPTDALSWGLVAFALVACFLAWKNERDKNREPETTRVQLTPNAVGKFVVLLQQANKLVGDATSPNLHKENWQSKAVEWFQKAEALVESELAPNESIRFNTISPSPIIGQSIGDTVNCLQWRRNKLWAMVGRLLPDDWLTRRVS